MSAPRIAMSQKERIPAKSLLVFLLRNAPVFSFPRISFCIPTKAHKINASKNKNASSGSEAYAARFIEIFL